MTTISDEIDMLIEKREALGVKDEFEMNNLSPESIIQIREATHGNWQAQSLLACSLKDTMRQLRVASVTEQHVEALEMIAVKISRILCGDPCLDDHWNDIAGYAMLGKSK